MGDRVLDVALERFKIVAEAEKPQRERELDDLQFQVPELQWPDEARKARQGGAVGDLTVAARPMLSIPKLDHPIQLVLNAIRSAHLGVQIHPHSETADTDTAETIQGIYRRIEVDSKADLARYWAAERAVKCGRGFYRILTEYDPAAPQGSHDQRIVIKRLLHQEAAYLDPFAEEADGSDAEWGFITQWVPFSRYKRQNKGKKPLSKKYDDVPDLAEYSDDLLDELGVEMPEWCKGTGESRMILIAEYFSKNDDGKMVWRKLNGVEVRSEKPWPGRYVPIIRVLGRELIPFDTDRRFVGIIGPNKDGQRFFNVMASNVAEVVGSEPKATWVLAEGQEEGHEPEFLLANVRNLPYIRYKPTTVNGEQTPPPQRSQADTSKLTLGLQALAMAGDFIHAGTAAYEPSLGQQSKEVKSGKQALALQQQHEQGNSNWLDSLSDAVTHEARIVLDLMPHIYDREGRIARTIDGEDNHDRVMLNQPFVRQQGKLIPVQQGQQPPQGVEVEHYPLNAGANYLPVISVGKAYKSRLEEGNEGLGQLFQAEPELFKVLGDIWLKFQTWPGHVEAANRMKKMLPPGLAEDDEQNIAQQAQQLAQENAMLKQKMAELEPEIANAKIKAQADIEKAKIGASESILLAQMNNATKIRVAEITAAKEHYSEAREDQEESVALRMQIAADALEATKDRVHEANMAQMQHQQAMQQADQAHQNALEQGDAGAVNDAALAAQGHDHALEQGAQGIDGTLAAQQQAADLAPEPEAGE